MSIEAAPADVAFEDGAFHHAGAPDRTLAFEDIAATAHSRVVPGDLDPGLAETTFYGADGTAYSFGTHAVAVSIDPGTGAVDIEASVAVDDCGEWTNPEIVEGQVQGGVAQGIAQARQERAVYDEDGGSARDTWPTTGCLVPRTSRTWRPRRP